MASNAPPRVCGHGTFRGLRGSCALNTLFFTEVSMPRFSVALEQLENRLLLAANLRSFDGSGNNLVNASLGAAGNQLIRLAPAAYANGTSAPAGANRPSARAISNAVAAHPADDIPSAAHLAAFAYLWGQFVDHDLDLTTA